jgi:hypothetical protein
MVVGRNVERGEKTIAEIRAAGGKADFISSDLRDAASAGAVARKAVELGGGLSATVVLLVGDVLEPGRMHAVEILLKRQVYRAGGRSGGGLTACRLPCRHRVFGCDTRQGLIGGPSSRSDSALTFS